MLRAGDIALLPHGTGHALADSARQPTTALDKFPLEEIGDRTYRLTAGGAGTRTLLACCSVSFEAPAVHPLLELMPPLLLVHGGGADDPMLPMLLEVMAAEVVNQRMGAATVMTRLADAIIARVVRAWVESRPGIPAPGAPSRGWSKAGPQRSANAPQWPRSKRARTTV